MRPFSKIGIAAFIAGMVASPAWADSDAVASMNADQAIETELSIATDFRLDTPPSFFTAWPALTPMKGSAIAGPTSMPPSPAFIGPALYDGEATASTKPPSRYRSLGSRMGAAKWEALGIMAYTTAVQSLLTNPNTDFHFKDEGWFGKDTKNLGIDKLTHAFNAYIFSEFLGHRIARKTGDRAAAALPGALMGFGLQFYGELWDAHKTSSGFSMQDLTFNGLGAAFSVIRHTVPGLEEKLDFRLLHMPMGKRGFYRSGKKHYEQQHFMFALELAGFDGLKNSPLRFVELHLGYRGKDFTNAERAAGVTPKRDIFFGVGLNVKQLFFRNSKGWLGRAIGSGLNYFQIPYVATHNYDGW